MSSKRELRDLLEQDRDSHLELLSSFVKIASDNPPGDTREAAKFLLDRLTKAGIEHEVVGPDRSRPNIVATFRGGAKGDNPRNLVLNGHIDQFPVNPDETWKRGPYSGDIADGFVHGRGSVDMKAGTVASLLAFSYMHKFNNLISGRCTLELVSDEETGGRLGTKYLIEQDERRAVWRGDCVLNAEPSGLGSIRFGEKGTLRITFEVNSQGGHGAYIHRGEGAIRAAVRLIDRLLEIEKMSDGGGDADLHRYLRRPDVREVADSIMSEGAADSMLVPTVNVGTIRGGAKVNMIPSYCVFEVDMRLPLGLERGVVLARIEKILDDFPATSYVVHEAASNPSSYSDRHHDLVGLIQENAQAVFADKPPLPIVSMGATDCKHFRYGGIPAFAYGPSPETMAEVDERVSIDQFLNTVKVHTLTAWDFLNGQS